VQQIEGKATLDSKYHFQPMVGWRWTIARHGPVLPPQGPMPHIHPPARVTVGISRWWRPSQGWPLPLDELLERLSGEVMGDFLSWWISGRGIRRVGDPSDFDPAFNWLRDQSPTPYTPFVVKLEETMPRGWSD